MTALEVAIILGLILVNGLFSLAELAIVSARRSRLQALVKAGRPGARAALSLSENPGRFLPTVQIGITLVSILTGTFSGSTLGAQVTTVLRNAGLPKDLAEALGIGLVVAVITYLSIVAGELVPKRFALRAPEAVACRVAPLMTFFARLATPAVWFLDASTAIVFRVLGVRSESESTVSDAEIQALVAEAEDAGIIDPAERDMIAGVMRLGDRPVQGVMTPRTDVDWIDLNAGPEQIRAVLVSTQHSRLPVGEGSTDGLLGVVQTRELLGQLLAGTPLDVRIAVREAPAIPDTAEALDALALLQSAEVPMALVHDEYGHFVGVVTPADLLKAIAGVFRADTDAGEPGAVQREDGSWLVAGWLPVDEMAERLRIQLAPERDFNTAAGYILAALRRLPRVGEHIQIGNWRFEVVDLDGRRIDMLIAVEVGSTSLTTGEPNGVPPHRQ